MEDTDTLSLRPFDVGTLHVRPSSDELLDMPMGRLDGSETVTRPASVAVERDATPTNSELTPVSDRIQQYVERTAALVYNITQLLDLAIKANPGADVSAGWMAQRFALKANELVCEGKLSESLDALDRYRVWHADFVKAVELGSARSRAKAA